MSSIERLAPILGGSLRFHDSVVVDGREVKATVVPRDAEALSETLSALDRARLAVIPRGAGTQLGHGNLPSRADAILSLEAFRGVDTLDAAEGVCHAGAGTPLAELRAAADQAGWELPLDDAGRGGTLGGALATGVLAPRALGFGRPRDVVLGLEVVLADGSRTRCGGRVVKNVTGYDMAKLYTGSLGAVGVITGAWLRLAARPAAVCVLAGDALPDAEACRLGNSAARRATARSCLLVGEAEGAGLRLSIELAGDEASVDRDAEELAREGLRPANPALRDAAARRRFADQPGTLRFAVSFLPDALEACLAALREVGAEPLVLPGLGLVSARVPAARAEAAFAAAESAARAGGGRSVCEWAPPRVKRGRDVFGVPAIEAALASALKARFDPEGVLNRGRAAGRV